MNSRVSKVVSTLKECIMPEQDDADEIQSNLSENESNSTQWRTGSERRWKKDAAARYVLILQSSICHITRRYSTLTVAAASTGSRGKVTRR
ncbi:hypothetical protein JTB14_036727 [Gonioctena quinquepunctata]|nr:hypothetical protein JTB14_036727 [Gonioctena quinquepunctata]